jgi:hypothetical protein
VLSGEFEVDLKPSFIITSSESKLKASSFSRLLVLKTEGFKIAPGFALIGVGLLGLICFLDF